MADRTTKRDPAAGVSNTRRALGSWLEGPPRRVRDFAGKRLRLPESGRGSVASFGEKFLALLIDLMVSSLIGLILVRPHSLGEERLWNSVSVAVFVLTSALLLLATGRTLGQRIMALQVVRLDGRRVGARAFLRQLLVALLVPALINDADRRGLHDRICRTVVVRVR